MSERHLTPEQAALLAEIDSMTDRVKAAQNAEKTLRENYEAARLVSQDVCDALDLLRRKFADGVFPIAGRGNW